MNKYNLAVFRKRNLVIALLISYTVFWQIGIFQSFSFDEKSNEFFKENIYLHNTFLDKDSSQNLAYYYLNNSIEIAIQISQVLELKQEQKFFSVPYNLNSNSDLSFECFLSENFSYCNDAQKNITIPRSPPFYI